MYCQVLVFLAYFLLLLLIKQFFDVRCLSTKTKMWHIFLKILLIIFLYKIKIYKKMHTKEIFIFSFVKVNNYVRFILHSS